jgi:hypothetical protein
MEPKEMMERLQQPFPASRIEWRVAQETKDSTRVMVLAYLTSRAVMERLDEVFGPMGWQTQYSKGPDGGVMCGIAVRQMGEGDDSSVWVTKWDGAENTDFEPVKGGLSGSMKRAAVHWGIGRYLYDLDSAWVPLKSKGKNYHRSKSGKPAYWDAPLLPSWALPKGTNRHKQKAQATIDSTPDEPVSEPVVERSYGFGILSDEIRQAANIPSLMATAQKITEYVKANELTRDEAELLKPIFLQKRLEITENQ